MSKKGQQHIGDPTFISRLPSSFNLLSTAELNQVIHNLDNSNDAIHEHDDEASVHGDNSDDSSDIDASCAYLIKFLTLK